MAASRYGTELRERFQKEEQQRLAAIQAAHSQVEAILTRVSTLTEDVGATVREETNKYRRSLAAILDEQLVAQKKAVSALLESQQMRLNDMVDDAKAQNEEAEARLAAAITAQQARLEAATQAAMSAGDEAEAQLAASVTEQQERVEAATRVAMSAGDEVEAHLAEIVATQRQRLRENLDLATETNTRIESQLVTAITAQKAKWQEVREGADATIKNLETRFAQTLDAQHAQAEALVSGMLARHSELERSITESVDGQRRRLDQTIDDVIARAGEMEEKVTGTRARLDHLEEEALIVEQRCHDGEVAVAYATKAWDEIDHGAEELERRLYTAEAGVVELTRQAQGTQVALSDAVADAGAATATTQQLVGKIESLRESVAGDLGAIAAARARFEDLQTRIEACDRTAETLNNASRTASEIAGTLEAVLGPGAELRTGLDASAAMADERCGQLNSHHAAAAHTLKALGEANVTAHQTLKDIEQNTQRAIESASGAEARVTRMVEQIDVLAQRCNNDAERMAHTSEEATELVVRIQACSEVARQATDELAKELGEVEEQRKRVAAGKADVAKLIERLPGITRVLEAAREAEESIAQTMTDAKVVHAELSGVHGAAKECGARLDQIIESASDWITRHDAVCIQATDAGERLANQLAHATGLVDGAEQHAAAFNEQTASIAGQLSALASQAAEIKSAMSAPAEIIATAQGQAAQLERVCGAVRKVFAGLSKSTLQADEQVKSLASTQDAAKVVAATLKEWVNEAVWVQKRLERTVVEAPSLSQTHSSEAMLALTRQHVKEKEGSAAGEVTTLPTRSASVGEVHPTKTVPASRVEEISALIKDARTAPVPSATP